MINRMEDGLNMLLALGSVIDDPGESNHGNIMILDLDYAKFELIEKILDYMGVNTIHQPPYELNYDSSFYVEETVPPDYNQYNTYTNGIIIYKKKMEEKIYEKREA